jgi:pimeloyl-ACP methyl ester carboxylesterase
MQASKLTHGIAGLLLLAAFLMSVTVRADTVEVKFPSGLTGMADYRTGKPGFPAVLLLHGFLQTRNSPPMNRLADALADSGYPVLVPTLTLGISRRNKSLSCEAVHKHTLQDDVQEIDHWVNWLGSHGYKKIILIGHSSGSKDLVAYLSGASNTRVARIILTSIVPIHVDAEQYRKARAEKPPAPGQAAPPLRRFTIAYCKNNYAATLPAYLSYADWTGDFIMGGLAKINVPADVVLGSKDQVLPPGWQAQLMQGRAPVHLIEGAGHFFESEYEFELSDRVIEILKR